MPYAVTISGTFDKYRGLALGLVVAGSATSAPLFPQVAGRLTETWGWQSNFILLGTISAVVSVIGLTFFVRRSEEHTSELQSLMRISYAVFCLKTNTTITTLT